MTGVPATGAGPIELTECQTSREADFRVAERLVNFLGTNCGVVR
ncbi:MAG: hypothetical protein U0031_00325 [Thermomicrobiales bacterium]